MDGDGVGGMGGRIKIRTHHDRNTTMSFNFFFFSPLPLFHPAQALLQTRAGKYSRAMGFYFLQQTDQLTAVNQTTPRNADVENHFTLLICKYAREKKLIITGQAIDMPLYDGALPGSFASNPAIFSIIINLRVRVSNTQSWEERCLQVVRGACITTGKKKAIPPRPYPTIHF